MKKAGIVCDNYKVEKFEAEMKKNNFAFETHFFNPDSKIIQVSYEEKDLPRLTVIVKMINDSFKQ